MVICIVLLLPSTLTGVTHEVGALLLKARREISGHVSEEAIGRGCWLGLGLTDSLI
jgi:hypothetical protein